jgi:hypothetical protein
MADVKVIYAVSMTEHERGWGQRPEGYLAFLTEADADAHIKAENAAEVKRNPGGHAPDVYWTHHKKGYLACSPGFLKRLKAETERGRLFFDRKSELTA